MEEQKSINPKSNNVVTTNSIAYLTLVGWFISMFILNNPRQTISNFHLRQALGINLLLIASGMLFSIPLVGWLIGIVGYLFSLSLWIIGLAGALKEEERIVPVLGEKFQEWFQAL